MPDAVRFLNDLRSRKLHLPGDPRDWTLDRLVKHAGAEGYSFSHAELRRAYAHLWQVEAVAIQLRSKSTGCKPDQGS